MLKWPDVLNLAKNGNPAPDRRVFKKDGEWRAQLTDEEYYVTRKAGTESAFSSEMCSLFEPGIYSCLCCDTVLFDASENSSPIPVGRLSPSRSRRMSSLTGLMGLRS
jgi:peptide-methionine (R)-S-oxide reductase